MSVLNYTPPYTINYTKFPFLAVQYTLRSLILAGTNFSSFAKQWIQLALILAILDLPKNSLILINHDSLREYHKYHSVWTLRIGEQFVAKRKATTPLICNRCYQFTTGDHLAICCKTFTTRLFKICTLFDHPRRASIVQCHRCSRSTVATGSKGLEIPI